MVGLRGQTRNNIGFPHEMHMSIFKRITHGSYSRYVGSIFKGFWVFQLGVSKDQEQFSGISTRRIIDHSILGSISGTLILENSHIYAY